MKYKEVIIEFTKKTICFFIKHKDGKKEISYIDTDGNHYMSKCLRCGSGIFYSNEAEEFVKEAKKRANQLVNKAMRSL